jgi:uncharacterized lipoprotein YddW (UPF0748 family)
MNKQLHLMVFIILIFISFPGILPSIFSQEKAPVPIILVVDDFTSPPFAWKDWYEKALTEIGFKAIFAGTNEIKKPDGSGEIQIDDFPIIIWNTGIDKENTLSTADQTLLGDYLEKGGNLLLTGAEIPQDLVRTNARAWMKRYLRCDFLMPNSPIIEGSIFEHETLAGGANSIFDGLKFSIDHGEFDTYPADNLNLIYEDMDPEAGGGGAVHCARFEKITGNLGVQFEGPILPGKSPCRFVFLTFPLETVHPEKVRLEMLKRAFSFFSAPEKIFYDLHGIVKSGDENPANLENAVISIKNTTYKTLSQKDGSFILSGIPGGSYELEASLFGYAPKTIPQLAIPRTELNPLAIRLNPQPRPLVEGRGIWVVRDAIRSPEAVKEIVDRCCQAGFNALFVQVRGRGDAYYNSDTEPRADILLDQPADFDPLAMFIELAHAKNIQVHAWMNAFYTYEGSGRKPSSPKHVINRHPEWVLTNRAGKSLAQYTREELNEHHAEGIYLSPCIPAAREYLAGVYLEVVQKYNVDGIHFDFIRFPFSGNQINSDWDLGYSELARKAFKEEHGMDPLELDPKKKEHVQLWNNWRRICVSRLVEDVNKKAHALKPDIRVSAAVLERYHLARDCHCFQDWIEWLQSGKIDTCCIMAYNTDNPLVGQIIRMATENKGKGTIWAGLRGNWSRREGEGIMESILERVDIVRRSKPEGVMFFAYKHFSDEECNALRENAFGIPAVAPSWKKP